MSTAQHKAVNNYRRRLKRQGMARVEVHVSKDDVILVRGVAEALTDPERVEKTRSFLKKQFAPNRVKSLKALLAAAPLDGIELTRSGDRGRDVDL